MVLSWVVIIGTALFVAGLFGYALMVADAAGRGSRRQSDLFDEWVRKGRY